MRVLMNLLLQRDVAVSFHYSRMQIFTSTGFVAFSSPANRRLFSTLFGFVGIGTCAILSSAMLLKARTTEARYVRIAEKGIL
jgi:hypothetical protein